jgi:hypothetical protein
MMLNEREISEALHAGRVVPLQVANPHGPLGLEQLAAAVKSLRALGLSRAAEERVRRPIDLSLHTWEKLSHLAAATSQATATPVSTGELVTAIVERYVADARE